jgi:PIN domain nuclease of toxin-antitoxin system
MIILDTHVWLWFLHDSSRLSDKAQEAIAVAESEQGLKDYMSLQSQSGKLLLKSVWVS